MRPPSVSESSVTTPRFWTVSQRGPGQTGYRDRVPRPPKGDRLKLPEVDHTSSGLSVTIISAALVWTSDSRSRFFGNRLLRD